MRNSLRVFGALLGSVLLLWGAFMASNEVLFHDFGNICADGNPEFDPAVCGITWTPGIPFVLAGFVGLALLAISGWNRTFTRLLLGVAGGFGILLALFLLWTDSWVPVNPRFPEPAGPQVILLCLGLLAIVVAIRLGRAQPRVNPSFPLPSAHEADRS